MEREYSPGFYGGSYIPNYRYTQPILTTANGQWDFENDYSTRANENEDALSWMNNLINLYTQAGKLDAIVEAFISYSNFINDNDGINDWRYVLPVINTSILRPSTLTASNITPKNNKCYNFPFSSVELNGYGNANDLAYENFKKVYQSNKHKLEFDIVAKWFAGVSIQLIPVDYDGLKDNFDYAVAGQELSVFPYTKDEYLNEYHASRNTRSAALNAMEQNTNLAKIQGVIGGVMGVGSAVVQGSLAGSSTGVGGAIASGIGSAVNAGLGIYQAGLQLNQYKKSMEADLKDTANRPSAVANQNASPSSVMLMKDAACPFVVHKAIRPEILNKVDRFFTRFGYKTNRTGIPNIYKRENFCYLECKNAVLGGNIPAEDLKKLKAIMEHGITFWHHGSTSFAGVGEYKDADATYNVAAYR